MPEQEGMEMIRVLRAKFPAIPIIAMSGGGRGGPECYLSVSMNLGADRTFAKPFRIEELLASVLELTSENT
jgi:DNA-binding response OmpR family regulator